jgi:ketosteroid isomerase-like protein
MAATPSVQSLIEVNAAFYRAFEALDFPGMDALWEASERVFCVHPGWQALSGREAVMRSWRDILANTSRIQFTLTRVQARVEGRLGVVTLYEHIQSMVGGQRHQAAAVSTNLFSFHEPEGAWKLFHHHASLTAPPEEAPVVN